MDRPSEASPSEPEPRIEGNEIRHRIYGHRITVVIIFGCSLLFLGGIWASGIDMESLVEGAKMFDSSHDICLRTSPVDMPEGSAGRAEVCTEWIDQRDMSGKTHTISVEDVETLRGADGKVRIRLKSVFNYGLVIVTGFLLGIVLAGRWVQRYLIMRSKKQLGLTS